MTYLTRWRLELAARTLERTSRGVAEIAGDVGYEQRRLLAAPSSANLGSRRVSIVVTYEFVHTESTRIARTDSSRWSAWFLAPGSCLSGSERFISKVSNRGARKTGVSTRRDCHGNGRTGPHQRRVSYSANQGAHTDYGTRQAEVVAKWIGGATDLSSFRLTRQIEAHNTVECRHEVCNAIGTFFRSGWKGKISIVSGAKTLREGRCRSLSGLSCEQRANRLHSKKATPATVSIHERNQFASPCRVFIEDGAIMVVQMRIEHRYIGKNESAQHDRWN